jgi:hypothetical protein
MKSVSLNDHRLHEVQMPLVPYSEYSSSYLRYPKHRIQCERKGDELVLKLPSFLALELYRQGILPQGNTEKITIEIGGKRIGKFVIVDFRYPNDHSGMITITLQKIRQKA